MSFVFKLQWLNTKYIILAGLIFLGFNLNAQKLVVDNSGFFYQVAPLFDFKKSVVSLTFDDGSKNQFEIGMPMLKERGLPATFYLITNIIDTATNKLLAKNNSPEFEFGSHTSTHPDLIKIGDAEDRTELLSSKSFLKSNFGNDAGLTMSYPWGRYNPRVKKISSEYYMAARSTDPGYNSFYHLDRYSLKVQSFDRHTDLEMANAWVYSARNTNRWLIEMIHGINGIGYSPVDSGMFSAHLDFIKDSQNDIWCSTVSNVIKYIDESKNAIVECDLCSDSIYTIRVDDFLDDSVYDQLLTLRIKIPSYWEEVSVSDIEKPRIEINNKSKFVIFNALPDNSQHFIRPTFLSMPKEENGLKVVFMSENPFNDKIILTLESFEKCKIDVFLYDMSGRILIHQSEMSASGIINYFFNTSKMSSGAFILRVNSSNGQSIVRKFIKAG